MLSLATSHVHAVRAFGIGAAVGVMVDFVISLVFVPTLLAFVKGDAAPPPQERWLLEPMRRVAAFSIAALAARDGRRRASSPCCRSRGILKLRVDTNHINFFADGHPLHESADLIDRRSVGRLQLPGVLRGAAGVDARSGHPRAHGSPPAGDSGAAERAQGGVAGRLRQARQSRAERRQRRTRRSFPASRRSDRAGAVRASACPTMAGASCEHVAASDYSRAQMTVRLASMSSDVVFAQIHEAEQLAERAFAGTGVKPTVTGSGRLFAQLDHYLVMSQLSSFATAFVTVFARDLRRSSDRSSSGCWRSCRTCSRCSRFSARWAGSTSR